MSIHKPLLSCDSLDEVPTPALVVDLQAVERNIARMADYASQHNLNIRPHTKTHKSLDMARLQVDAGAEGLTAAKVSEAQVMLQASQDVLVAYPIVAPLAAAHLAGIARTKVLTVCVAVDSIKAVEVLSSAARSAGSEIGILVDLDVGFHRTGLQTPRAALELAQTVDKTKGVRLDGLFCYPGHVHGPAAGQTGALKAVQSLLEETLGLWRHHGLRAAIVSGGSTPTAMQSHLVKALTEIRPGTYIYNDRNSLSGGYCQIEDCAATLLCTVVSNAVPGKIVIDAGSKSLSSDRLAGGDDKSGFGLIVEFPEARIVRLSEEHGEVDVSRCSRQPELGQRVHVIPNHVCPCVNLQPHFWCRRADGKFQAMRVDAQGCTT